MKHQRIYINNQDGDIEKMFSKEKIAEIDQSEYHRRENFHLREQLAYLKSQNQLLKRQIADETEEKYKLLQRIAELTSN